ncbi:thioredoxin domain-containing protein [Acidobacteria bacterium AH-259-D05]|nr:thioredoxin domain-containing protein [Acidobacteria bacterium AH-259-D05]
MKSKSIGLLSAALFIVALTIGLGMRQRFSEPQEEEKQSGGSLSTSEKTIEEGQAKPNRLINEKSPYLLQHARNPVDWYPWGEEAFQKARNQNKPIFLSIGYSTCHWCHVMERESFSNLAIAAIMNRDFVSIKVDREERPDVDQVYMAFVQASTGSGGWPMSVFVTPQLQPFFGGTYFPPQTFENLLLRVAEEWKNNREAISRSAGSIIDQLKQMGEFRGDGGFQLEEELLDQTYQWHRSSYDASQGGFGGAPKFPRPVNFNFLFRYYDRTGQKKALEMTTWTLRKMARGGIHDQIGGGFHRYSTDDRWFLPHFEKMLYDQAQLAISYLEAYQISRDPLFEQVARGIFEYVLRDMTGEEGGFYSAEDADSPVSHEKHDEHAEGAFYVWTHQQLVEILGEDAAVFNGYYGVQEDGNVEQDRFGEFEKKNILHISSTLEETTERFGRSPDEIEVILEQGRHKLLESRGKRPRPGLDDKVLTAWNGLMISSLALGYQVLQEEKYLKAAERAAKFITDKLYEEDSRILKRRYRAEEAAIQGLISDYAFFIQGLLDLYESSLDGRWLILAMDLTETQNRLFWDVDNGGFYSTPGKDPSILIRMKEDYDGAEPSPNSVAVLNLLRLSQMSGNKKWGEMAERAIQAFQRRLKPSPQAMPQMMVGVNFYLDKPKQILIAGERNSSDTRAILREVHKRFLPNKIVVLADGGAAHQRLAPSLEILDSLRQVDGKATAYICENYVCKFPTNDVSVVARLLDE